jgi:hypothetical protein
MAPGKRGARLSTAPHRPTTVRRVSVSGEGERSRISRRKGSKVAVFAMARHLAQLIYRMLKHGQDYLDIGADRYEALMNARRLAGLKEAARSLGYDMVPTEAPAA